MKMSPLMIRQEKKEKLSCVSGLCFLIRWCVCVCISLQEVSATPVRFISDLLVEDSWSHVFMDTLAPRGFIKVRQDRGRERSVDRYRQNGCVYLNS